MENQVKITKRQFAIDTLMANKPMLDQEGPKQYRDTCMNQILAQFPETSKGSLGAIYNDAKHILVDAGELEAFGRHGKGKNHNSPDVKARKEAAKGYQVPDDHNWLIINKETRAVEGSDTSKNKANKAKTDAQTVIKKQ